VTSGARARDEQTRAMIALIETQAQQIEALRDAVDALEGRLALRSELDVIVAHEVRTPLTVITGALETLADMPVADDRITKLVAMATEQATHLGGVVDELLEPQGNGGPVVNRARLIVADLGTLMTRALAAVSIRLRDRHVETDFPEGLKIATAPTRLTAIVVNLLENAARYGADPVTCRAGVGDGVVWIEVADRGVGLGGLDPEDLFEPFTQGVQATDEGRGVGLFLVRMLARSMGGEATLADRAGGGCVARVELPQRRANDPVARLDSEEEHRTS
jgi:two-component system sensor histidine kinase KdpD